jgi:hypothetical protein
MSVIHSTPGWKTDGPVPPGKSRRSVLLGVLLGLVGVVGVFAGVLYWLSPPAEPALLPIAITSGASGGAVPWLEEDRQSLAEGGWLGKPIEDWSANPNRDQIRLRFRALAREHRSRPLVVYLASSAAVDSAGEVYLLPADQVGDHPRNRLPLAELLTAFHECPARHRLLVLNLVPAREAPQYAAQKSDLSVAVFDALEKHGDPGRLCLVSCGTGQAPLASAELGRSLFGWYLEAGLRGEADGWQGTAPDGRVSVHELAAFLQARVGRWSRATQGEPQTPVLVGAAPDFTIRALSRGESAAEVALGEIAYPDWLRSGWERSEQWQKTGRAAAVPWAFRKLQAALLDAERDLRNGKPAAEVHRELEQRLAAADQLAQSLSAATTPDPLPTLATLFPGYVSPDPTLLTDLREAARRLDSRMLAPPPAPGEKPIPEPPVPPEFESFKAKPQAALALAAFLLLAEDGDPTPARLRAISRLLAQQTQTPRFAETALIQRLTTLAGQKDIVPWSSEGAALALQTARLFEPSVSPETYSWARAAIDEVYRLRAGAEALYFSPGYAPAALASHRLREAATAAHRLHEASRALHEALRTQEEAFAHLNGAAAAVHAGIISMSVAEQLAAATRRLADALRPPRALLGLDAFAERAIELARLTSSVRAALVEFDRPFRSDAIAAASARAGSADAGPATAAEMNILLATPLLSVTDRATLWKARAQLERRLAETALQKDVTDREAIHKGLAAPESGATTPSSPVAIDTNALQIRIRWTASLLRAGGLDEAAITALESELQGLLGQRFAFSDRLRKVWLEEVPARMKNASLPEAARLARLAPLSAIAATEDVPASNPEAVMHLAAVRSMWLGQTARFEHESLAFTAEDSALAFAISAARACRAATGAGTGKTLEVAPAAIPKLTPDEPATALNLSLRATGSDSNTSVRIAALTPAEGWVKVGPGTDITLDALRQGTARLTLAAGDNPVAYPGLLGVLVEAEADGWVYHRRVPVVLEEITDRLDLFIRPAPGQPPLAARDIRVRPNGTMQPYQLLLGNPTPRERKVVVRLAGLNRETDVISIPSGKTALLAFPSPPLPPAPPAPPGQPVPVAPDQGIIVKDEEFVLQLFDPTDRDKPRQTIRIPVVVANPADYLRVTNPLFQPAAGSRANRLSVTVVPGDIPPGGPCNVRLGFPPDRNPGLVIRDGSLTGPVERAGPPLTLYTDNLALATPAGGDAWVTIGADGVERVLTFFAPLPSLGESVRLTPQSMPRVQVKVDPVATGTAPLPVTLEVDNAPPGATLQFVIGTARDDQSPVAADLTMAIPTAKEIAARLKFDPKGETLLISGSIKDHEPRLPVELLVGKRVLEARLLDRGGKELTSHRASVTFDGTAPRNVHFIDLPPRARKDQPLAVRAACDPTVSGIKEVKFFLGAPQKNALPQNPPPIAGKLLDAATNQWRAVLPVEGQKGIVTVGVRFTTSAGLSTIETQEVELVDAAELDKPRPGQIAGKLIESKIPQPGAVVFLYDDKGNARAKTTTRPDGSFDFKELVPGPYYLFSEKESTGRQVKEEVTVKPGETTGVTLELLLK